MIYEKDCQSKAFFNIGSKWLPDFTYIHKARVLVSLSGPYIINEKIGAVSNCW